MEKVIIFGIHDFAELAHYYITHDSPYEVLGFTVHKKFIPQAKFFRGLPVVPFEEITSIYPPTEYRMFAPLSPSRMNRLRETVYSEIKSKGYKLINYISSKATFFDNAIGDNCFILEDNTIQPFTSIGNNVVIWSGNHIGHHGQIKDHVFFSSHVVLSGHCIVDPYCFFGVNSTIRDGLHIAEGSLIAMSASVIRDTEPWGVYKGSPAMKDNMSSKDFHF